MANLLSFLFHSLILLLKLCFLAFAFYGIYCFMNRDDRKWVMNYVNNKIDMASVEITKDEIKRVSEMKQQNQYNEDVSYERKFSEVDDDVLAKEYKSLSERNNGVSGSLDDYSESEMNVPVRSETKVIITDSNDKVDNNQIKNSSDNNKSDIEKRKEAIFGKSGSN